MPCNIADTNKCHLFAGTRRLYLSAIPAPLWIDSSLSASWQLPVDIIISLLFALCQTCSYSRCGGKYFIATWSTTNLYTILEFRPSDKHEAILNMFRNDFGLLPQQRVSLILSDFSLTQLSGERQRKSRAYTTKWKVFQSGQWLPWVQLRNTILMPFKGQSNNKACISLYSTRTITLTMKFSTLRQNTKLMRRSESFSFSAKAPLFSGTCLQMRFGVHQCSTWFVQQLPLFIAGWTSVEVFERLRNQLIRTRNCNSRARRNRCCVHLWRVSHFTWRVL